MKSVIKHKPSFATIHVQLQPGDSIVAEAGAMASMSSSMKMRTRWNGGFFRAVLRRLFGGESLFVNEFYCPEGEASAEVVLTQPTPGDMQRIDLKGETLLIQSGGFIACGPGVALGLGWAGLASLIGGEGLFRLRVSGEGPVWIGGYGGLFEKEVDGEYVVDSGHLIAYEPTIALSVGLAGGLFSSLFSGEGLVTRLRGQGKVIMQSRSLEGLAAWTNASL